MRQHGNWAAKVPAGTQLADKQELVRNNGSEPASLDPHKVESDVEFNIISDLFDGLVSVSPAGEIQPRPAEKWENKDNTVWTFHLRPGITGAMEPPSPRKILSGAGSGWSTRKPPPYASYPGSMRIVNGTDIAEGKSARVAGVKAINDTTLEVTLTQPNAAFRRCWLTRLWCQLIKSGRPFR